MSGVWGGSPWGGGGVLTVGRGGDFSSLQAAVNSAIANTQFTEVTAAGTASVTLGSRSVTVPSCALLVGYTYISFAASTARKWYPIARLGDDNVTLRLDVPFQEATDGTAQIVIGNPDISFIEIVSDISENVYFNSTGLSGGVQADAVAIGLSCAPGARYDGTFRANAKSGVVVWDDVKGLADDSNILRFVAGTDTKPVTDVVRRNSTKRNSASGEIDFLFPESTANTRLGRVYIENVTAQNGYDVILPAVLGRVQTRDCLFNSDAYDEGNVITRNQPIARIFGGNGVIAEFIRTTMQCSLDGLGNYATSCYLGDAANGVTTSGHTVVFDHSSFVGEHVAGATEMAAYSTVRLGITNSDTY